MLRHKLLKSLLTIILTFTITGCGSQENEPKSEAKSFGSWSTMVGGTLRALDSRTLATIVEAEFFVVYMPVGLGIVHEFIGIKALTSSDKEILLTTGLVGDVDDTYFSTNILRKDLSKSFAKISSPYRTQRILRQINQQMIQSYYNNQAYYVSAMTATPLFGRPCANEAKRLKKFVLGL